MSRNAFKIAGRYAGQFASRVQQGSDLTFSFAVADGTKEHTVLLRFPVGKTITVDWGDDTTTEYNGAGSSVNVTIAKTYAQEGSYPIKFYGDWKYITYISCFNAGIGGDISNFKKLTSSLTYLVIYYNDFTGDVGSLAKLTKLTSLYIDNNNISGDASVLRALSSLTALRCQDNSLEFSSPLPWVGWNISVDFTNNNFSSNSVDNALNAFAGGAFIGKNIKLGGTNADRTNASHAAMTTLVEVNGNTVTVNGGTWNPLLSSTVLNADTVLPLV